jgi:hypothetical protein
MPLYAWCRGRKSASKFEFGALKELEERLTVPSRSPASPSIMHPVTPSADFMASS